MNTSKTTLKHTLIWSNTHIQWWHIMNWIQTTRGVGRSLMYYWFDVMNVKSGKKFVCLHAHCCFIKEAIFGIMVFENVEYIRTTTTASKWICCTPTLKLCSHNSPILPHNEWHKHNMSGFFLFDAVCVYLNIWDDVLIFNLKWLVAMITHGEG